MAATEAQITGVWTLALYFAAVVVLVASMIGLSYFLGERHRGHATDLPYESGVSSFGSAQLRISAKFYLVALFFVVFDLEAVFVFAWAVALRQAGWTGFAVMSVFMVFLLAALFYLWRMGALDWSARAFPRVPVGKDAHAK